MGSDLEFYYGWPLLARMQAGGNSAPGLWPLCGAVAVPVTRVFSPYVVQAGWARPRVRTGLLCSVQPGW